MGEYQSDVINYILKTYRLVIRVGEREKPFYCVRVELLFFIELYDIPRTNNSVER